MYLYELLEEERREATEHKSLVEAQKLMDDLMKKGYQTSTIKRLCRGFSDKTAIAEAVFEQGKKVAVVQAKIRMFMKG